MSQSLVFSFTARVQDFSSNTFCHDHNTIQMFLMDYYFLYIHCFLLLEFSQYAAKRLHKAASINNPTDITQQRVMLPLSIPSSTKTLLKNSVVCGVSRSVYYGIYLGSSGATVQWKRAHSWDGCLLYLTYADNNNTWSTIQCMIIEKNNIYARSICSIVHFNCCRRMSVICWGFPSSYCWAWYPLMYRGGWTVFFFRDEIAFSL